VGSLTRRAEWTDRSTEPRFNSCDRFNRVPETRPLLALSAHFRAADKVSGEVLRSRLSNALAVHAVGMVSSEALVHAPATAALDPPEESLAHHLLGVRVSRDRRIGLLTYSADVALRGHEGSDLLVGGECEVVAADDPTTGLTQSYRYRSRYGHLVACRSRSVVPDR